MFIADTNNHRIRAITPAGVVSTLAGTGASTILESSGTNANFYLPNAVAVNSGGTIYVADTNNHLIRAISPSGIVSTVAGAGVGSADGIGTSALFNWPSGVAVDTSGNVFIADLYGCRIRVITPAGSVFNYAGSVNTCAYADGAGTNVAFSGPTGVAVTASGTVIVADRDSGRIRAVFP